MAIVGKRSLVSQAQAAPESGALTALNALPAQGAVTVPVEPEGAKHPYVWFAHPLSPNDRFGRVSALVPGLKESDPVLILPEPAAPLKLDPFRFMLIDAVSYFGTVTGDWKLHQAWYDRPEPKIVGGKRVDEYAEALIFAFTRDGVYPATVRFKGAKLPALKAAVSALTECQTPEWVGKSPDHAVSVQAPRPYLRFTCSVSFRKRVVKSGEMEGKPYYASVGEIKPASAADWAAVSDYARDADRQALYSEARRSFAMRQDEIRSKLVTAPAAAAA